MQTNSRAARTDTRRVFLRSTLRRRASAEGRIVRKRSKMTIGGLPLWEIARGPDLKRGERRGHARAILAVGDIADGVVAIGGMSRGIISVGGLAAGVVALGGISIGLLAALGGLAAAPYAMGGVALGAYARGGAYASLRTRGKLVRRAPWWRRGLRELCGAGHS